MEIFQNLGFHQEEQERKTGPRKTSLFSSSRRGRWSEDLSYRLRNYFTWGSIAKGRVSVSTLGRQWYLRLSVGSLRISYKGTDSFPSLCFLGW